MSVSSGKLLGGEPAVVYTRGEILRKFIRAVLGLWVCSIGVYLTVVANIGMGAWESLNMGLSYHLPISYGVAATIISLVIVFVTIVVLKAPIGVSTLLDAFVIGPMTDFWLWLDPLPRCHQLWVQVPVLFLGMVVLSTGQWLYISAGMGAGPRDSFMVNFGKLFRKLPISVINGMILVAVAVLALLLNGPVGLGTVITLLTSSFAMQLVFRAVRFEPRDVVQQNLLDSLRCLLRPLQSC